VWRELAKQTGQDGIAVFDLNRSSSNVQLFAAAAAGERQAFSLGNPMGIPAQSNPGGSMLPDRPAYRQKTSAMELWRGDWMRWIPIGLPRLKAGVRRAQRRRRVEHWSWICSGKDGMPSCGLFCEFRAQPISGVISPFPELHLRLGNGSARHGVAENNSRLFRRGFPVHRAVPDRMSSRELTVHCGLKQ